MPQPFGKSTSGGFQNGKIKVTKSQKSAKTKGPGRKLNEIKNEDDASRRLRDMLAEKDKVGHKQDVQKQDTLDTLEYGEASDEDSDIEEFEDPSGEVKKQSTKVAEEDSEAKARRKKKKEEKVFELAKADELGTAQRKRRFNAFARMIDKFEEEVEEPEHEELIDCSTAGINKMLKKKTASQDAKSTFIECIYGTWYLAGISSRGRKMFKQMKDEEIAEQNQALKGKKCKCDFCEKRVDESGKRRERAVGWYTEQYGKQGGRATYEAEFGPGHVLGGGEPKPT